MKELLEFIYDVTTGNCYLKPKALFIILKLFFLLIFIVYICDHYNMAMYSILKMTFIEVSFLQNKMQTFKMYNMVSFDKCMHYVATDVIKKEKFYHIPNFPFMAGPSIPGPCLLSPLQISFDFFRIT